MDKHVKTIADILSLENTEGAGIHEWSAWAVLHVISAATLSRLAGEIEASSQRDSKAVLQHRAFVTGAILISVTFLESTINELFAEAKTNPFANVRQLDQKTIDALASETLTKVPFLSKYQRALRLAGRDGFNQNKKPYSEVEALRKLRVAMQHDPPQWKYAGRLSPCPDPTLPKHWLAGRFPRSGMTPEIKSENLHAYLGHGCAEWAVEASIAFTDEFYRRLGMTAPYDHLRGDINPG